MIRQNLMKYRYKIISNHNTNTSYSFQNCKERKIIKWLITIPCKLFKKHNYVWIHNTIDGFQENCEFCYKYKKEKLNIVEVPDWNIDNKEMSKNILKVIRIGTNIKK